MELHDQFSTEEEKNTTEAAAEIWSVGTEKGRGKKKPQKDEKSEEMKIAGGEGMRDPLSPMLWDSGLSPGMLPGVRLHARALSRRGRPAYFPGEEIFNRSVSGQGRRVQAWRVAGSTRSPLSPWASPRVSACSSCCAAAGRPKTAPIAPTAASRWAPRCLRPAGRSSPVSRGRTTPPTLGFGAPHATLWPCMGVQRGQHGVLVPPAPAAASQSSRRMGKYGK